MAIEKWTIIEQAIIFAHPRLTLIEDTVALPNGNQTTYLRFKRDGDAASIIAEREDGQVLLQREYSHPPNKILYQFPGGGVPLGEDIAAGANRELMEEAGLRGDLELIGKYFIDNRRTDSKLYVFVAKKLREAKRAHDDEEFLEHSWFSVAEIDELIKNDEIENAHALAAWALYKTKNC